MWWVTSVFGVEVGTAILPVFSLEVYLVAVMSTNPDLPWWVCGPAAALGQVLGEGVHYLAARGALKLPRLLRRPFPWEVGTVVGCTISERGANSTPVARWRWC